MMSGGCLEVFWKVSGGCLESVLKLSGGYLDGVVRVSGRKLNDGMCLEGIWMCRMSVRCLERVGKVSNSYCKVSGEY